MPERTLHTVSPKEVIRHLGNIAVGFERLPLPPLETGANDSMILSSLQGIVNRFCNDENGCRVEVSRVESQDACSDVLNEINESRKKLLREHYHEEDEVWFFVSGHSAFYVRDGDLVYIAVCGPGDLIRIPARKRHWFDMGTQPSFCALRFYRTSPGFVGVFTQAASFQGFPFLDDMLGHVESEEI